MSPSTDSSSADTGPFQAEAIVPTPGSVVPELSRYDGIRSCGRTSPQRAEAMASCSSARRRAAVVRLP